MWDNIGGKIKTLAKVIAWLGIISSIIGGIILIIEGVRINQNSWFGGGGGLFIGIGFGTIIGGVIFSWIGSWFMYGFGELIENSETIVYNTSKIERPLRTSSESNLSNIPPVNPAQVNYGDNWVCKCGKKNPTTAPNCKECGEYK